MPPPHHPSVPATGHRQFNTRQSQRKLSSKSSDQKKDKYKDKREYSVSSASNKHPSNEPLPVPTPKKKVFNKLTSDQKMGNIVSVLNIMCRKMEEQDCMLNHNTDGLETKLTMHNPVSRNCAINS